MNDIVEVVDLKDWPLLKLTYHVVPEGNPDSVNVAVYVYNENDTSIEDGVPAFSVNDPPLA